MPQHFFRQTLVKSTLFGCLLLSGSFIPPQSTVAHAQILATPQTETIAQQVLQEAIAKKQLDNTAKVVNVERIGRDDIWMYNPVPHWKIAIAAKDQNLVYFATEDGNFSALMQKNGQNLQAQGKPAQEVPPPEMITAAIDLAKEWGYPAQRQPRANRIASEKVTWASGCENISAPYACDPVARQGWQITIPHRRQSWVMRGETAEDLQLIARSNPTVERSLPTQVSEEIKRVASQHLQIPPSVVLITKVESQTFSDGCLGLGNLAESCIQQMIPGYRVTVAGQGSDQQIYRISEDAMNLRTEAIAGLPTRTDELPTEIARIIFNAAQTDLGQPIANLSISQVEPTFECFRSPTAAPDEPCFPLKSLSGWTVTVTNFQESQIYTVNLSGQILEKKSSATP